VVAVAVAVIGCWIWIMTGIAREEGVGFPIIYLYKPPKNLLRLTTSELL
jgi:hypothetical protein